MKFLIIDNYDSFVYNVAQYLGDLGVESDVIRNDAITLQQIKEGNYDAIVISPGPGTPTNKRYFGICLDVIKELGPTKPILGICLGHQGIIHAYGGKVTNAACVRHGKTSMIEYIPDVLFHDVPNPFSATRYHSLVGEKTTIPDCIDVTATACDDNEVMAIQHKKYPIYGVQFHPESIMTPQGKKILENFIKLVKNR